LMIFPIQITIKKQLQKITNFRKKMGQVKSLK
jgi:hypothetical protein